MEDPILEYLTDQAARLEEKTDKWIAYRDQLLPMVTELIDLTCEVDMSDGDLNIRFSGDKQRLLKVVRCQFRHGLRPDLSGLKPGESTGSWTSYVSPTRDSPGQNEVESPVRGNSLELRVWTYFSSTVCKRVQTGTRVEEVPVYETVCDDMVPYDLHDEIPF